MTFMSLLTFAQDFAPIGAKWHYTENFAFTGDKGYLKIESIKDTLFHEKNCKLLSKTGVLMCSNRIESEIVYSQDSAVYFWDKDFNIFQKLYDFKVVAGSQWSILVKHDLADVDTIKVIVDSISTIEILNKTQKVLNVSYSPSYYNYDTHYSSKIVYSIGDFTYLFNFYPYWSGACDFNYSGGLRCYEDSEFGYYSTGIADSCTYTYKWTNIENIKDNQLIVELSPNPTHGKIKIISHDNINYKIFLLDDFGRIVKKENFQRETNFDISTYPNGIYFILIQDDKGMTNNRKVIKN